MNAIFINCNNLSIFNKTVKTYSESVKKTKFYVGIQDVGIIKRDGIEEHSVDDVKNIFVENGINDFELILASDVEKYLPTSWKTEMYNYSKNYSLGYFGQWFILKYKNIDKLFVTEEDISLNFDINKLFNYNKSLACFMSFNLGTVQYGELNTIEWLKLQNKDCTYSNWYNYISKRTVWGSPKYYCKSAIDMEAYETYFEKVFNNKILRAHMTKVWHHGYFDQHLHSFGPIEYDELSNVVNFKLALIGKRTINKQNYNNYVSTFKNGIIHFAGSSKCEVFDRVQEAANGKI